MALLRQEEGVAARSAAEVEDVLVGWKSPRQDARKYFELEPSGSGGESLPLVKPRVVTTDPIEIRIHPAATSSSTLQKLPSLRQTRRNITSL